MLKIRAVRLEVNTTSGLFGAEYKFSNGLNIIRGDNTTGKSSLFQSILYGLGFEELLGGKNEKTMQSVLKDQVEFPDDNFHTVIQSFVYLEIENKEIVTIKRSITSEYRKSQLIDVYSGALITGNNTSIPSKPMYIHDKGGASNNYYGFHAFLSEFINWKLPELITSKGENTQLYLQQIASAFIIEQKTGWSDFFATLPYYAMGNADSRVIEFLLELDVFENEKQKQQLKSDRQTLNNDWNLLFFKFNRLAERSGGILKGLENRPIIINSYENIYIEILKEHTRISIFEFNEQQRNELSAREQQQIPTVGKNISKNEIALREQTDRLDILSLSYEMYIPELSFNKEKLKQYRKQLDNVREDLRRNKGAQKVQNLGSELQLETSLGNCPTCHQPIKDSLLPSEIKQTPMLIEENILFLEAQKKMIEIYIQGQDKIVKEKEKLIDIVQAQITDTRKNIRDIKKELIQDERLPSSLEIEKRINLKNKIESISKIIEEFAGLIEKLKTFSVRVENIITRENKIPRDFLSIADMKKLSTLQDYFIDMLEKLDYQSKPLTGISISKNNYLPVTQKMAGEQLYYNIKFDSSSSDFIRCLWAFYTAILKTSIKYETNHPMLLMFDEPKQQDVAIGDFKTFLYELSQFKEQQVLVFASFENSDDTFAEATVGLNFNLNRIEQKLIKPMVN